MNVLLAAGPESTATFIITVQHTRSAHGSLVSRVRVPLNRWQGTHRRLLRDGAKILSVTPCEVIGRSATEDLSATKPSPPKVPQSEITKRPDPHPKDVLTKSLMDLAVESWCFAGRFERLLEKLNAGGDERYRGRLSWFRQKLNEVLTDSGMKLLNVEGHLFESQVEEVATPINREDFGAEDKLVVDRMPEPIIMGPNGIERKGMVRLKAVDPLEQPAEPILMESMAEKAKGRDLKEVLAKSLVDLAVESWRFSKLFVRLLEKLAVMERSRYQGQLSWFQERLKEELKDAGMKIVNVEGDRFDPGVAATPLNCEDFGAEDKLIVDRMLTPIIMGPDGIMHMGTVMLKKVES